MDDYDENLKPISPLGYVGFEILYAIPVVGFICMLVFAFVAKNQNVKNFARAQFIALVLAIIFLLILCVIALASGVTPEQLKQILFAQNQTI